MSNRVLTVQRTHFRKLDTCRSNYPATVPHATASRISVDSLAAEIAGRQHGVVSRAQLLAAGVSRRQVERRVKCRNLRPLHRGVYLVGVVAPPRAREMSAVLACGPGSVVSHGDAAALHGMRKDVPPDRAVHVTVTAARGRRPGIRAHRVTRLPADEVASVDGIPATTPARTLLDLAGLDSPRALEQAFAEATRLRIGVPEELKQLLDRYPRRPGIAGVRALLERPSGPAFVRSEAEARFLALVREAELPEPEMNVALGRYELDFLWRRARIAVEVDGFEFHGTRRRFERDRRRDARLLATHRITVMRVTWMQLVERPAPAIARLARVLGQAEARRGGPDG
ncbi:MAG TPA: type IV toxin-antitoxin system AbiEi family antitoxin domain-containing protein [Longimicrobiales bacterium]|nr:type IV toxin-antitoxin system AbiEi family antitoxin domain-containing protein [Longimicrobiales bacterium]